MCFWRFSGGVTRKTVKFKEKISFSKKGRLCQRGIISPPMCNREQKEGEVESAKRLTVHRRTQGIGKERKVYKMTLSLSVLSLIRLFFGLFISHRSLSVLSHLIIFVIAQHQLRWLPQEKKWFCLDEPWPHSSFGHLKRKNPGEFSHRLA